MKSKASSIEHNNNDLLLWLFSFYSQLPERRGLGTGVVVKHWCIRRMWNPQSWGFLGRYLGNYQGNFEEPASLYHFPLLL